MDRGKLRRLELKSWKVSCAHAEPLAAPLSLMKSSFLATEYGDAGTWLAVASIPPGSRVALYFP